MNKRNFQKELEQTIEHHQRQKTVPKLLLHSCCAPCSSYVLEYLSRYFRITVLYYNPNIYPPEEYDKRAKEQQQFIQQFSEAMAGEKSKAEQAFYPITFVEGSFEQERFYQVAKGLEDVKEGGERCFRCYELRLREAAEYGKKLGQDYFTTTLSISPLKNVDKLTENGEKLAKEYGISYLNSDFKKKNGYKRSVELSKEYGMYRQDYCGCVYSKREREQAVYNKEQQDIHLEQGTGCR